MTVLRPEALATLHRWREVIAAAVVAVLGLWLASQGGLLLIPLGLALAALAAFYGLLALRRMRFAQSTTAPGLVEVDEGQIGYMGPSFGGFVALPDLAELRLLTLHGQRMWRLKQQDGQVLLIPVAAAGAERLFDAFATLPGMDTQALVAALSPAAPGIAGLPAQGSVVGPVIWHRAAKVALT
ncbi:hypothetical protein GEU84_007765 [Fertoebacter nigrum]|uniref:Uncharacterized protein n=1 Tax=Fertoeibacter niger TaxID=2656921 RepID=A0A8X8GZR5_9RHOB|nr:hypothetical protein [Fertoeibacter niger]NUB44275.1 hypothetical protein [Fertoeibacter niger]